MLANVKIPSGLDALQIAMGRAVATPFTWDEDLEYNIQTESYSDNIVEQIISQKGISSRDRLMLYNRGYWWRLFTIMQEEMPLMVHLLSYAEFNRFASAYLEAFPSDTQTLNYLLDTIPKFMAQNHEWSTPVLIQAAELEYYYIKAFDAAQLAPLDPQKLTPQELDQLPEKSLTIQPHTFLFEESWNLMELRVIAKNTDNDELMLEPEEITRRWLIYRSLGNRLNNIELNLHQWNLLHNLKRGLSFSSAIEKTFAKLSDSEIEEVAPRIQQWFSDWVSYGIFSLSDN